MNKKHQEIIVNVKSILGSKYTPEDHELLTTQLEKHKNCATDDLDVSTSNDIVHVDCLDCSKHSWSSNLKNINTSEKIVKNFKEKLYDELDIDINDNMITEIKERLAHHKECISEGEVDLVYYGDENITIECNNCNEVILDSDVVELSN